jgi:hypothetical protein
MIRVFTDRAVFDGLLRLSVLGRTLDELNLTSRGFLLLESPTLAADPASVIAPQIAINKGSILFVFEHDLGDAVPSDLRKGAEKNRIAQSVLHLSTPEYAIEGNVHVFQSGHPLARIYMPGHPSRAHGRVGRRAVRVPDPFRRQPRARSRPWRTAGRRRHGRPARSTSRAKP